MLLVRVFVSYYNLNQVNLKRRISLKIYLPGIFLLRKGAGFDHLWVI